MLDFHISRKFLLKQNLSKKSL